MPKYEIKDIWSGKDDIPVEQEFSIAVKFHRKQFGEDIADYIVNYVKKNKLDKDPGYGLVLMDGRATVYLDNKTNPKFLANKSITEKHVKAIAEYICESLTKYADTMYKGLSWCSFSVTSKDGIRFLAQIERIEDKSESNKHSTTRANKILESLSKRNRRFNEANIKFKSANDTFSTEFEKRVIEAIFKDLDLSFEKNNPYSIDNLEDNVNRSVEFVLGLSKLAEKSLKAMQNVYFYLSKGDQDNAEDSRYEYEDYYNRLKSARSNSNILTVLPDPKLLIKSIEKSLNK